MLGFFYILKLLFWLLQRIIAQQIVSPGRRKKMEEKTFLSGWSETEIIHANVAINSSYAAHIAPCRPSATQWARAAFESATRRDSERGRSQLAPEKSALSDEGGARVRYSQNRAADRFYLLLHSKSGAKCDLIEWQAVRGVPPHPRFTHISQCRLRTKQQRK